jgi:hypothetical protein
MMSFPYILGNYVLRPFVGLPSTNISSPTCRHLHSCWLEEPQEHCNQICPSACTSLVPRPVHHPLHASLVPSQVCHALASSSAQGAAQRPHPLSLPPLTIPIHHVPSSAPIASLPMSSPSTYIESSNLYSPLLLYCELYCHEMPFYQLLAEDVISDMSWYACYSVPMSQLLVEYAVPDMWLWYAFVLSWSMRIYNTCLEFWFCEYATCPGLHFSDVLELVCSWSVM